MLSPKRWFFETTDSGDQTPDWTSRLVGAALAMLLVALVFSFSFHQLNYHWNWSAVYKYRRNLLSGWLVTILISVSSLLLSTLIGVVFALVRRAAFLPLRYLAISTSSWSAAHRSWFKS
jgi:polar amino acid transport system permease protein